MGQQATHQNSELLAVLCVPRSIHACFIYNIQGVYFFFPPPPPLPPPEDPAPLPPRLPPPPPLLSQLLAADDCARAAKLPFATPPLEEDLAPADWTRETQLLK